MALTQARMLNITVIPAIYSVIPVQAGIQVLIEVAGFQISASLRPE